MISQSVADWGCRQIHGNIGVKNTMPAICVQASVVWAESAPASLRVASTYPELQTTPATATRTIGWKRPCSWARRDHYAEKSERDCDHAFRAHSFTQHRSRKKSHENRREK
jgi:hypothetical protein